MSANATSIIEGLEAVDSAAGVGGGGSGEPEVSLPPAKTESVSTHTSAADANKRLIGISPVVVVNYRSGFAARTLQHTPDCLSDKGLFDSLVMSGRFADAIRLCRERLLAGHDPVRWTKDRSIVSRAEGNFEESLDLLASVYSRAMKLKGVPLGKFENSFGRTYELMGETDKALDYYTPARFHMEEGGDFILCANVDNNTGRCYVRAHNPEASHFYFDRAAEAAKRFKDLHLLGEIEESRALAFEAVGDYVKAFDAAAQSVGLLAATSDEISLAESLRTRARIVGKVGIR